MADEALVAHEEGLRPRRQAGPGDPRHLKLVEEALVGIRRGTRDLSFYPPGHPALARSLERLSAQIRQALEAGDPLSLTIGREAITHDVGEVGKGNPTVKSFAAELFQLQVKRIHIGRNFTLEELRAFLGLLGMDPKRALLEGGPEPILAAAKVRHIQVNQLHYSPVGGDEETAPGGAGLEAGGRDLVDAIAPAQGEEVREAPTQSPHSSSDPGEMVGGIAAKMEALLAVADAPVLIEDEALTLEEVLERLEWAEDLEYRKLARRLDLAARNAMAHGALDHLLRIMGALARHRNDPGRPEAIRRAAAEWVDGAVSAGALDFLVGRLCQRDEAFLEEILALLGDLGERAMDALLLRLTTEETMSARRRLIGAIVRQGDPAIPAVLRGLRDERWFVVRNMATILGELGREHTVEPLGQHIHHRDRRVRREVVGAIAKIGGRHAPRILRECVDDDDHVISRSAIAYLGRARDPVAIKPLLALAEGRQGGPESLDRRLAAIQALGQIGNRTAAPPLAHLLLKGFWRFWREPEDIRIAAAAALGQLGGPEAAKALERVANRGGRLGETCRETLARLQG